MVVGVIGVWSLLGGGGRVTFPSKVGQFYTFGNGYKVEVIGKTTVKEQEVFKVHFTNVPHGYPAGYAYADSSGRVWKVEAAAGYIVFDYRNEEFYDSFWGSTGTMPKNFVPLHQLFMGSWWKKKDLSPGKSITISTSIHPEESRKVNMEVLRREIVSTPAGKFDAYVLKIPKFRDSHLWVDSGTGILIKSADGVPILKPLEEVRV